MQKDPLDGIPEFLRVRPDDIARRKAAWDAMPPPKPFVDPKYEAAKALREQQKKIETTVRIARLKKSLAKPAKINTTGLTWSTKYSRWENPQEKNLQSPFKQSNALSITQEDTMPRLTILPYDINSNVINRGKTSINASATSEQIDAQIAHAIKRGGAGRVASVEVTDNAGNVVRAWSTSNHSVKLSELVVPKEQPAEPAPAPAPVAPAAETETDDMAKRKAAAAKRASNGAGPRKVEQVIALCERASGCTLADIKSKLGVTDAAAASLIGDVRRLRKSLKREKGKDGASAYHL